MERELWPLLYRIVVDVANDFDPKYTHHQSGVLVAVFLWAAIHERTISWACNPDHWDTAGPNRPTRIPSAATLSRRVTGVAVGLVWRAIEDPIRASGEPALVAIIDGKPLPIRGNAKDPTRGSVGGLGAGPRATNSTRFGRIGRSRRRGKWPRGTGARRRPGDGWSSK
jgi:hypothetical protein